MKIEYDWKQFNATALDVIHTADTILNSYSRQGYQITLRTLYYQFIARDLFPESRRDHTNGGTKNTEKNYKWLGKLISDARLAGLIDWNHLEDSGRSHHGGDFGFSSPEAMIEMYAPNYGITHWNGQSHYVEVWVEKQALESVVERPCSTWRVPYFACKGYVSQSSMHEAANRIKRFKGRTCTIIHLGDHDPSGIDMSRDIQDRMMMFGCNVEVQRIALNMDQVEQYNPPPSPAKITDSRAADYIANYGDDSWELDALEPSVLDALITEEITSRLNMDLWNEREAQEEEERRVLVALTDNFSQIREYMVDEGMF
jgi:hypothetical protein